MSVLCLCCEGGRSHAPGDPGGPARGVREKLGGSSADDREDVARGEDQVLLAAVLDLGAAELGVDDAVADGDVHGDTLVTVVVETAGADGNDLALLRLLLGGVRDDEAGRGGLLGLDALDDDPVLERLDGNRHADSFGEGLVMSSRCAGPGAVAGVDQPWRWHSPVVSAKVKSMPLVGTRST